jgi:hypothetical protein
MVRVQRAGPGSTRGLRGVYALPLRRGETAAASSHPPLTHAPAAGAAAQPPVRASQRACRLQPDRPPPAPHRRPPQDAAPGRRDHAAVTSHSVVYERVGRSRTLVVIALSRQSPCGRSGLGSGRSTGIEAIVVRASLKSFRFRAGRRDPERDTLTLAEEAPLRFLALSVGFGPVSSPPNGAIPSAPSIANRSHSIPNASS